MSFGMRSGRHIIGDEFKVCGLLSKKKRENIISGGKIYKISLSHEEPIN